MIFVVFALLTGATANTTDRAEHADLKSPFGRTEISVSEIANNGGKTCNRAPAVIRDIKTVSKFGAQRQQHSSSLVDPVASAQYTKDIQPLTRFTRQVAKLADRYALNRVGAGDYARCALKWMDDWGKGDGLLGEANATGQSVRKWELATLATAYLKIQNASVDLDRSNRVAEWLRSIARKVRDDYSHGPLLDSRSNNHLNWAAWAVMAASIAAGDQELFDWSLDRFHYAIAQIDDDGTLPLELKRRQLALAYHNFALAPLIMLREGAYANNVAIETDEDLRLRRLVDTVFAGLEGSSTAIEAKSGYPQELSPISKTQLAWLEPYYARTGDPRAVTWLRRYRPMASARLGGNLTTLYSPLPVSDAAQ